VTLELVGPTIGSSEKYLLTLLPGGEPPIAPYWKRTE